MSGGIKESGIGLPGPVWGDGRRGTRRGEGWEGKRDKKGIHYPAANYLVAAISILEDSHVIKGFWSIEQIEGRGGGVVAGIRTEGAKGIPRNEPAEGWRPSYLAVSVQQ